MYNLCINIMEFSRLTVRIKNTSVSPSLFKMAFKMVYTGIVMMLIIRCKGNVQILNSWAALIAKF